MSYFKDKLYSTSVTRKVIAGFFLVFISILFALGIAHFGFREMMGTVNQLSEPNKQLSALNTIFQEIASLDQLQREEAIKNPKNPYKSFTQQSQSLVNKIDSLYMLDWDSAQETRLSEIKEILQKRNRLFFSYLKLKSDLVDNRSLTKKMDTLTRILEREKLVFDTSVVTTQKKTTTTYTKDSLSNKEQELTGLRKLFTKKKKVVPQTTQIKVQEELSVVVDTLSVARQNKSLEEVERIIIDLESEQRAENKKLLNDELELIHANSLLINQLLSILHDVENEEFAQMRENNNHAVTLVTDSIFRISVLLIVFFIGAALLVYLIWVDIARSNYYKQQLEKSRDEAEELSQIKQRFLANMSHEIRTPLQSIIGFAEQLKHQRDTNQDAVSAINSSSEHLLHIVNEVLDYSRISSGNLLLNKENFKLIALIREIIAAVRIQSDKKGLTLLLDLEYAKEYNVSGDPFRLRQILYNLLGNAIKFTSKGFVKLDVKTREKKGSVECIFDITDTGIGIRPDDLKKIFNQFEQANSLIAPNYGGTGLGLTIVKSLVEAQHGTLDVSSDPGHGSSFKVTITFERAHLDEVEVQKSNISVPSFKGGVIVVDDDVMILKLCSLVLEKNGIRFKTYNNPKKLLAEHPDPDVTYILMDIRMPEMNGVELCQELRKKYPESITYVALTAHVFPQERQQLLEEGFDAVLPKPFREQELLQLMGIEPVKGGGEVAVEVNSKDDVDLSALKTMTMGDEALFQSIINQFVEETEEDLHKLNENLKLRQQGAVREIVHKLAGRLGQMGISALSTTLRGLEVKLVGGSTLTELDKNLSEARDEVEKLVTTIRLRAGVVT